MRIWGFAWETIREPVVFRMVRTMSGKMSVIPPVPLEHSDQFAFVVSDGKLPERSGMTADDHDDVAGPDIDDFPAHETRPREDDHVEEVVGGVVPVEMLLFGQGRRNTDGQSADRLESPGRLPGVARTGSRDQSEFSLGHRLAQEIGRLSLLLR